MNILLIENCPQEFYEYIKSSRFADKIVLASTHPNLNIPNIEYQDFEDLSEKAKALQIDLAIIFEKDLIEQNLVEFLKYKRINTLGVNKKWFYLESSRSIAKQLVNHYKINSPKTLKAPVSFPIVIKTDKPNVTFIAKTMQDLVNKKTELEGEKVFLEEFLEGDAYQLLSLWDGKNLITFSNPLNLNEVQIDRLDLYRTKLNFLLSDEKANFIGFFTSKLIWSKNDWYLLGFEMNPYKNFETKDIKLDFLYLVNSAIYQKLNEI